MDFVRHFFSPTDPEAQAAIASRYVSYAPVRQLSVLPVTRVDPELLKPTGDVLTAEEIAKLVDPNDSEARIALEKVNARKPINQMYKPKQNFANEVLLGMNANVERGKLGLVVV